MCGKHCDTVADGCMVTIFSNSIDLGSQVVHKIITTVLLGNVCTCCYFFVNLATVLNVYLRCLFFVFLKETKSNQILQFLMLFCRIKYFPAMQYEIPPSFVFLQLRSIFRAALVRARVCSLYHGVRLFSLIFLKCKGATVT